MVLSAFLQPRSCWFFKFLLSVSCLCFLPLDLKLPLRYAFWIYSLFSGTHNFGNEMELNPGRKSDGLGCDLFPDKSSGMKELLSLMTQSRRADGTVLALAAWTPHTCTSPVPAPSISPCLQIGRLTYVSVSPTSCHLMHFQISAQRPWEAQRTLLSWSPWTHSKHFNYCFFKRYSSRTLFICCSEGCETFQDEQTRTFMMCTYFVVLFLH